MVRWWSHLNAGVCFTLLGREWSDWSSELRIPGDELKWKFISDGSVNGWGWRFTVYPIMPAAGKRGCDYHPRKWNYANFSFCDLKSVFCPGENQSESLPGEDQTKSHLSLPVVRVFSPVLTS